MTVSEAIRCIRAQARTSRTMRSPDDGGVCSNFRRRTGEPAAVRERPDVARTLGQGPAQDEWPPSHGAAHRMPARMHAARTARRTDSRSALAQWHRVVDHIPYRQSA